MELDAADKSPAARDRFAWLVLWTGLIAALVGAAFTVVNWEHLTNVSVAWAAAVLVLIPVSAGAALISPSRLVRGVALTVAAVGWVLLIHAAAVLVLAWIVFCPGDETLCGTGPIRRFPDRLAAAALTTGNCILLPDDPANVAYVEPRPCDISTYFVFHRFDTPSSTTVSDKATEDTVYDTCRTEYQQRYGTGGGRLAVLYPAETLRRAQDHAAFCIYRPRGSSPLTVRRIGVN